VFLNVAAQNTITIDASLDTTLKTITISQEIVYTNASQDVLNEVLFHDWANAFSNKTTALGKRFAEDFVRRFYFAKDHERGNTVIQNITDGNSQSLSWGRHDGAADILWIKCTKPLQPGESQTFILNYKVKVASAKFTRYGYQSNGNFDLKYWYILPAVYDKTWQVYNHKNLDDLYPALSDYRITMKVPEDYEVISDLNKETTPPIDENKENIIKLEGNRRGEINLYIQKVSKFYSFPVDDIEFVSNIEDNDLMPNMKSVATQRILSFLQKKLGPYPFKKILISETDYKINPVYGLNQLPDILRPFPDGFQYEIKQLKAITERYLENTLIINPRYDSWIRDGIHIYLMMAYTEQFYPDMKIIGKLSKIIGVRWFHLADLKFNDQYFLGYKNMARLYLDQPISSPQDKLLKFNKNIANAYKAGVGFKYLEDYFEDDNIVDASIKQFYNQNLLQYTSSKAYREVLESKSNKSVAWFFDDYVNTNDKIDFKIKSVKRTKDSIEVTIKNKRNNAMPISLVGLQKKNVVSKTWVTDIVGTKKVKIANNNLTKLVLDYDQNIPEVNRRNNYKNLKWIFNKPLQFRLFEDVEDPKYGQLFFIPEFEFNVYDGFTIASKFYNNTVVRRDFEYKVSPAYGLKSKKLLGSASAFARNQVAQIYYPNVFLQQFLLVLDQKI